MSAWLPISPEWLFLLCFAISIVSALLPWANGEILLLSCTALARSPLDLFILVLAASVGHMAGKCGLYWASRSTITLQPGRFSDVLAKWGDRFQRSRSRLFMLVFVSSAVGIPPFYAVTIVAGALRIKFAPFIAVGACGRLIRFGLLALLPQFALHMMRTGWNLLSLSCPIFHITVRI